MSKTKSGNTKDDAKRELKPKLRFPEFQDEPPWALAPLSEAAAIITEKAGDRECIPMSITSGIGLISQEEKFGQTIAGKSYKSYFVIQRDDFAYNKSATKDYPQGFIAVYEGDKDGAVPNSIFTCFRVNPEQINVEFLNYLFVGNHHGAWLRKFITVGGRAHGSLSIDDNDLLAMPIPRPVGESTLDEQQKIADCLTSLDELIAAHSRKLDGLQAHKKGLMQQLFPRGGDALPRLRLPEFKDAPKWRQTPLGKIVDFQSGGTPSKKNPGFWNGTLPWASAKDMKQLKLANTQDHITQAAVDEGAKLVPEGTVLMLTRGMTLLKDVPICVVQCPMSFNQDVKALHKKNGLDERFLPYLLLGNKGRLLEMVDVAGHGTGKLNTDELRAFDVLIPKPAEQARIADCLMGLEPLITAQSEKLNGLKNHKKGLMQQLFPKIEATQA